MDSNNSYLKQLYRGRMNLIYYLKNMGYDCDSFDNFSLEEIDTMNKYLQLSFKVSNPTTNEECYVKYIVEESLRPNLLRKNNLRNIVDEVFEEEALLKKTDTLVIVTTDYSEESVHKSLKNLWENEKLYVVVLNLSHMQINILKHSFVPPHQRMSEDEKKELYKRMNIDRDNQLPEISRFDPVAKIIFLRPGEVCRITRYDKISFTNYFYRICVS